MGKWPEEYTEILVRERMRIAAPSLDDEDAIVVQLYVLLMDEEAAAEARKAKRGGK